jgi:hypothetical protein
MPGEPVQEEAATTSLSAARDGGGSRTILAMVIGVALVAVVLAALLAFNRKQAAPQPRLLTDESRAYAPHLEFTRLSLSAADNMVGSQIVYLDGVISNTGTRTVRLLRLRLDFQDTMGQVILRQERELVPMVISSVGPGESREFQFRFDYPPASWNIQPPEFGVLSLLIE